MPNEVADSVCLACRRLAPQLRQDQVPRRQQWSTSVSCQVGQNCRTKASHAESVSTETKRGGLKERKRLTGSRAEMNGGFFYVREGQFNSSKGIT